VSGKSGIRLTPREAHFIEEGKELMYSYLSPYVDIEKNERNIYYEIGYSALTPKSKFEFQDKHGWKPSNALLDECCKILGKINKKRMAERKNP
jgi:hypothetical protein